jgi:hypothetical protein
MVSVVPPGLAAMLFASAGSRKHRFLPRRTLWASRTSPALWEIDAVAGCLAGSLNHLALNAGINSSLGLLID